MRLISFLLVFSLLAHLASSQSEAQIPLDGFSTASPAVPTETKSPQSSAQPMAPTGNPVNVETSGFQNAEGYSYDPTGRRDPFKPFGESQSMKAPVIVAPELPPTPVEPLQMYDISQFKLLGIIWQVKDPKAMILDPVGRTHMIKRQTRIGRNNGFVASIREGEVIVVEPSVGENGAQTAITRVMNLK